MRSSAPSLPYKPRCEVGAAYADRRDQGSGRDQAALWLSVDPRRPQTEVEAAYAWADRYLGAVLDKAGIRAAWVALLSSWRWDWFCTFTSREPIHPEQLDKRFRFLIFEMNCTLYPHRVHRRIWQGQERRDLRLKRHEGVYWCRAMEKQARGVLHYHALIGGVGKLRRLTWMDRWNELCGFAKIEEPRGTDAVTRYVAKYCMKSSGLGEIDLGGTLARFKPILGLPA